MAATPGYRNLFLDFSRLGLTSFGGPAMVAYIGKLAVDQRKWLSREDFDTGVALCQSLPGMTAMQSTAYVGLRVRGVMGAIVAFSAFVWPSLLIMTLASFLYWQTRTFPIANEVVNALQAIVVAIILNASVLFWKSTVKKSWDVLPVFLSGLLFYLGLHPVIVILLGALAGFLVRQPEKSALPADSRTKFPSSYWWQVGGVYLSISIIFLALGLFHPDLFQLAFLLARIDLMAFGGGFASVPIMFHEIVELRSWMETPDFLAGIALGQITPGPIAITATFVGFSLHGIPGAVFASFGILAPSFLLLISLAPFVQRVRSNQWFIKAVGGILLSFIGLIISVAVKFGILVSWSFFPAFICILAFISLRKGLAISYTVLGSLSVSLVFYSVQNLLN